MAVARIRIDFEGRRSIGIGKIELLEGIAAAGSLAEAARRMRMSYRRAWLLLEDMNASFESPVAKTSVGGRGGGGVRLTDFGKRLVLAYRTLEAEVKPLVDGLFGQTGVSHDGAGQPRKRTSIKKRSALRAESPGSS
jgi:molybdate transport system regulatory protein